MFGGRVLPDVDELVPFSFSLSNTERKSPFVRTSQTHHLFVIVVSCSVYAMLLGLLILVSLRFLLATINPIFFIREVNITVFVLGLLMCFVLSKDPLITRSTSTLLSLL